MRVKITISPGSSSRSLNYNMVRHSSRPWELSLGTLWLAGLILLLAFCTASVTGAQTELDDNAADPMKLFERGQNAHARGEIERALEFYEEAIKIRPEFPEAEFQRGNALVSLKRFAEAESAYRRTIELRKTWSLPYANLGALLLRLNRGTEAEAVLRESIKHDPESEPALRLLADWRLRAGDSKEALELARKATARKDAPTSAWIVRAMAERASGAPAEAETSLKHVLDVEPENVAALTERAELRLSANNFPDAIQDLRTAERLQPGDKGISSRLALAYERNGQPEEARHVAEKAGLLTPTRASGKVGEVIGTTEEIEAANSEDQTKARKALTALLEKNPRSALLLARLGLSYRTEDPAKSLDYYRRASELQPDNADYAVGYAAALVQERRFVDATSILRRVLAVAPDHYQAHANLATSLYSQKNFIEALTEYEWIIKKKPELVVTYYFIATAHDNLGEYPEALAAYETFLARASTQTNQLEIEKVKLRLPTLKRQIELGQGAKRKSPKP